MIIFKFEDRNVYHILDRKSHYRYSYCKNATLGDDRSRKDGDIIKEYEGERICKGCVGGAYVANVINIKEELK